MAAVRLLALVGPTASGKTRASLALAERLNAEIVSVDSMLVYLGMDVGTAKPSLAEQTRVRHHLIDLVEPSEPFSVARYQRAGAAAIREIEAREHAPLLVGGSGLYLRALVDGLEFPGTDAETREQLEREAVAVGAAGLHRRLLELDPVAATKIEPGNVRRTVRALEVAAITGRRFSSFARSWSSFPEGNVRAAGVWMPRDLLDQRIRARVEAMVEGGLIDEVRELIERGFGDRLTSSQAIGYAEFAGHLQGRSSREDAVEHTVKRTRNLARRQEAWLRRDPRIRWFRVGSSGAVEAIAAVGDYLAEGDA